MNDLSLDEKMLLDRIKAKPDLQVHFFGKIKKLKWFDVLRQQGFLDASKNPPPVNTEGDYYNIPSWPITEYLVASSAFLSEQENESYAIKYLELIRDVTQYAIENKYGNRRTWWQFSKVIRNIPVKLISKDDVDLIKHWIGDRFGGDLVIVEIKSWIIKLLNNTDSHSADMVLAILDVVFDVVSVGSNLRKNGKEPIFNFQNYHAEKLAIAVAGKSGQIVGLPAIELFESKLKSVLDIKGNDKWSVIWRHAVEDNKQNSRSEDVEDIALIMLRDSMLGFYQKKQDDDAERKLCKLLSCEYQTIRRIALYVAGESYGFLSEDTVLQVLNTDNFNDKFRHELWHFLNKNFDAFTQRQKNSVFETIANLSVVDDDKKIETVPTAYKKSNWYAAIIEIDDGARNLYDKCLAITGKAPDHPDFSSYSSSFSPLIHESPVTLTELRVMLNEPKNFVTFLNEYDYAAFMDEPGLEGLIKAFGELVSSEPILIFKAADSFLSLKPHYVHEIFSVFVKLWETKAELEWDNVWNDLLLFAEKLVSRDVFWNADSDNQKRAFIGNVDWVVRTLGRLIEAGCQKDENAFGLDKCESAKRVIELILSKQLGEEFLDDSDAVSIAINSPRGHCLEAYFKLALYQCRHAIKDTDEHSKIWAEYEPVFTLELNRPDTANEYEFATLIANYLPNFLYLSEDWVLLNLEKIFDNKNKLRWLCAIQGFSYVGGFDSRIYGLFKERGDFVEILNDKLIKTRVKKRYIQFICIGHLREQDDVDDGNSLISLLLNRNILAELKQVIWFLWSMRETNNKKVEELVYILWSKLINLIDGNIKEGRQLASNLSLWSEYITELNETTQSWLLAIAPYANEDYKANYLLESLARLSKSQPFEVFEIWKVMLGSSSCDYPQEAIKEIFKNLVLQGNNGVRAVKEIADLYLKHGLTGPTDWCNQFVNEKSN